MTEIEDKLVEIISESLWSVCSDERELDLDVRECVDKIKNLFNKETVSLHARCDADRIWLLNKVKDIQDKLSELNYFLGG